MKCAVCKTEESVQKYGSVSVPLCKEHSRGMFLSHRGDSHRSNGDTGYFNHSTGGGRRVIRSTRGLS